MTLILADCPSAPDVQNMDLFIVLHMDNGSWPQVMELIDIYYYIIGWLFVAFLLAGFNHLNIVQHPSNPFCHDYVSMELIFIHTLSKTQRLNDIKIKPYNRKGNFVTFPRYYSDKKNANHQRLKTD